ncbi:MULTISPECIES: alpha/beta hydrolase family protein [Mycolicibacterium]|jgi:acetyl esterase/lipase|uniref:Esterase n=4 Tax=Mycolicibacterium TaxID=1866885 RepID=A0A0U1DLB9_9MYCO|nr:MULTISPECIES: alpha/beta fold hydrolase [Mycolicibacterium]MDR7291817.1 acetyl esterase/lipase [Mycolicibacterium senegalense]OBJ96337.1 esterase [Mycolicibacterium conceptionense]OMB79059.1 esterase [Mycolicibacterium conceptionense]OMB84444.1 esterase [Mycolicibacterium conceptionense]OMB99187.1 esterase [Mycolicibacterium conceptionense]
MALFNRRLLMVCAALLVAGVTSCATHTATQTRTARIEVVPEALTQPKFSVTRFHYLPEVRAGGRYPDQNWVDLYLPGGTHAFNSIPLVVLIHGGGWKSTMGAGVFDGLARELTSRGMAVYNIEYRRVGSGGGWPTTFTDVARAMDYVAQVNLRYPQLAIDDALVVGHSAGAQLAVWASTRHDLHGDEVGSRPVFRPTRVISLAGPLDMVYAATHGDKHIAAVLGGRPSEVPKRYASVDPIQNLDPRVPVIAVHGTLDTVVAPANSRRYVAALDKLGGRAGLVLLPGENHTSIMSSRSPGFREVLRLITTTSKAQPDQLPMK